ncbi:hypothetical protein [Halomicrobium salinisoli]|uniref:hypothetical protein n=1 Tax=Halomicrobium salinisoli TaxID=2878391 RepID=UPI001CF043AB|nr:hypothetical protein [Halomicrobium salinisoli]
MTDPDLHDDTSRDYEQFEQAQLAKDRDAARVDTADVDDAQSSRSGSRSRIVSTTTRIATPIVYGVASHFSVGAH